VATALVSLDMVDQFLRDLGLEAEEGTAMRQAARDYLRAWPSTTPDGTYIDGPPESADPDEWLALTRDRYGDAVAEGLVDLAKRLTARLRRHDAWIDLMGRLASETRGGSRPSIEDTKFEWLRTAAEEYFDASDQLRDRLDDLETVERTAWDFELLSTTFYPPDASDDPGSLFRPGPHLWRLLDNQHWDRFRPQLKERFSAQDLEALVSWADRAGVTRDRLMAAV
jgi:hypothetical protein